MDKKKTVKIRSFYEKGLHGENELLQQGGLTAGNIYSPRYTFLIKEGLFLKNFLLQRANI